MATSRLSPIFLGVPLQFGSSNAPFLIDASGEKVGYVFRVPKTGNIDRICIRTRNLTSSQTLRVGIETLDGSGDPSGTQYGGSAVGTQISPAANTTYEITLATPASATVDDLVAVVVQFDSTAGNLELNSGNAAPWNANGSYVDHYTSSWSKNARTPIVSIRYDDGTYPYLGCIPACQPSGGATFNSGSSPDERALKIVLSTAVEAVGMYCLADVDNAMDLVLYDSGGTALETIAVSSVARQSANTSYAFGYFAARSLAAGTYYVSAKPGASNCGVIQLEDAVSANQFIGLSGDCTFCLSTRTDAGSWNDTTTSVLIAGLILSGIETGGGGGGGPLIGSRLVA